MQGTCREERSSKESDLTRSGGETGEETSAAELVSYMLVKGALVGASVPLGNKALRRLDGRGALLHVTEVHTIVAFIPVTEGGSINLHNGTLHQGLCTDELVGGGVVLDIRDTGLAGDSLRSPREVPLMKAQCAPFKVTTTGSYRANTGSALHKLGTRSWARKAELTLQLMHLSGPTRMTLLLQV